MSPLSILFSRVSVHRILVKRALLKRTLGLGAIVGSVLLLGTLCLLIAEMPSVEGAPAETRSVVGAARLASPELTGAAPISQTMPVTVDMSINQTFVAPGPFYPGQDVYYQLFVENVGSSVATSVTVTDVLPSEILSTTVLTYGDSVDIERVSDGPTFVWEIESLEAGQQVVIYIRGSVDSTLTSSRTITNVAQVAVEGDVNLANNQASVAEDIKVPVLQFATAERQIQEDSSFIEISIVGTNTITDTLPPNPYADIFVNYATVTGTATLEPPPADFTPVTGTAIITKGLRSSIVRIPINDDLIAEGTEFFSLELSDPTGAALGTPNVIQITIDDDESAGVRITPAELNVSEDGATAQYEISLRTQPTENVTVQIQPDEETTTSVSGVTFTPANWDQPQMIQVTAVDDNISEDAHQGFIQHSANSDDSLYEEVAVSDVVVNIEDNDGARIIVSTASLGLIEGEESAEYELSLGSEPLEPVTVTIVPDDQLLAAPTALYFSAINWSIPQTVTVTAKDDIVREEVHIGTIKHQVSSLDPVYNNIFAQGVTANIGDNDYSGILLSTQSIEIVEGEPAGSNSTYSVVLVSQPVEPVTVFMSASENLTVTPEQLTFTALDWAIEQPVSVQAQDDNVVVGGWVGEIRHHTSSTDRYYDNLNSTVIQVYVLENDQAALTLDGSFPLQVAEGGASASYGIALQSQPTSTVTLAFVPGPQLTVEPSVLAFQPEAWNVMQHVAVRAVNDGIFEGGHTAQLGYSVRSDDPYYDNLAVEPVTVNIEDGDTANAWIFLPIARQ